MNSETGQPVEMSRAASQAQQVDGIASAHELEPLLCEIILSAAELIGADYGAIGLVVERPNGSAIRVAAVHNLPLCELGVEVHSGEGLAGLVLQERRAVIIARYGELERSLLPQLAEHSVIGIPLWWGAQLIGFFGLGAQPPQQFNEQDQETLAVFARHAAIAIQNARLFEAERRRAARRTTMHHIGRLVTSRLRLDELLYTVVTALNEYLAYSHSAILLRDPDDPGVLVLRARGGVYIGVGEYRQQTDEGIIGAAMQAQQYLLVRDVWADPRYIPIPDAPHVCSELAVPIIAGDEVLGVLNIESERELDDVDAEDVEMIADQIGIAIRNAALLEAAQRRATRITIISHIGRLVTSSLNMVEIFQTAAQALHLQLGFAYTAAGLVDQDDPEMLVLIAQAGVYTEQIPTNYRQSIHIGMLGQAARSRRRILVNDVHSNPEYVAALGDSPIVAELVVPILAGDELLGVLNIESETPITEEDANGVEIIADQLAIALLNARRFESERRRTARLELIARVGQRIAARLDPHELFATTVAELHGRLGYDHVALFLVDEDAPRWLVQRARASRWVKHALVNYRQSIEQGIIGEAARTHTPQLINDTAADQRFIAVPGAAAIRAELAMPILLGARLFGVIDLAGIRRFNEDDVTGIRVIADQLAIAIQHAGLFAGIQELAVLEERRRLANELHDSVTQQLFSTSLLAQVLPDLWESNQDEAREALNQIRDLTRSSLAEMRALLIELRPAALGERGLGAALREHGATFERRTGVVVHVELHGAGPLPPSVERALFRIAQEAMANIARHSHAQQVRVSLRSGPLVRLSIADDGRGFLPDEVQVGKLGLVSMRERAAEIGATFAVASAPHAGTEIVVEWPDTTRKQGGFYDRAHQDPDRR